MSTETINRLRQVDTTLFEKAFKQELDRIRKKVDKEIH